MNFDAHFVNDSQIVVSERYSHPIVFCRYTHLITFFFVKPVMPFIDVGMDWIQSPSIDTIAVGNNSELQTKLVESEEKMNYNIDRTFPSLHEFLQSTPWWVSRRNRKVIWDGHSAFIESAQSNAHDDDIGVRKPSRIRSLRKKDLYQAWNAMMHTPRFVRRKLRRDSSRSAVTESDTRPMPFPSGEDSIGETVVWRRFMDQISDISYRADTKRLGDDHLHDLFGEFRHYIVEKFAYSTRRPVELGESLDVCVTSLQHYDSKIMLFIDYLPVFCFG